MTQKTILLTGGMGYIGSHTAVHLLGAGYEVVLYDNPGWHAFNLGTGTGVSVLELVKTFEEVNQLTIPCKITPRRSGDVAESYSDSSKAKKLLHWSTKKDIRDMCRDTWKFQMKLKETNT